MEVSFSCSGVVRREGAAAAEEEEEEEEVGASMLDAGRDAPLDTRRRTSTARASLAAGAAVRLSLEDEEGWFPPVLDRWLARGLVDGQVARALVD